MSLYAVKKWEAPDRKFIGHRDGLTVNMSRYHFAARQASGRCLDIGCGRGYGMEHLEKSCTQCTGLDMSENFLREARQLYPQHTFVHQNAEQLPFEDNRFDTVVSFEVIEHVQDDRAFLQEIRRVATPGALVVISTPNRLVASAGREKPLNKFHVREYIAGEFRALIEGVFEQVEIYGQTDRSKLSAEEGQPSLVNRLINKIPVQVKYLIPHYVQDVIGVMLRPPLKMEDCIFTQENLDRVHTLMAVCRAG